MPVYLEEGYASSVKGSPGARSTRGARAAPRRSGDVPAAAMPPLWAAAARARHTAAYAPRRDADRPPTLPVPVVRWGRAGAASTHREGWGKVSWGIASTSGSARSARARGRGHRGRRSSPSGTAAGGLASGRRWFWRAGLDGVHWSLKGADSGLTRRSGEPTILMIRCHSSAVHTQRAKIGCRYTKSPP